MEVEFFAHDGLVGAVDGIDFLQHLGGQGGFHAWRENFFQRMPYHFEVRFAQDRLGGPVAQGDFVLHIRGDYPAGDRGEHVIHQIL